MAKKTLTERFIQDTVAAKLNKEYYGRRSAFVATEAYTRLKRADVFVAFMRARNRPYVVVVEAKSRTTIHQLKLKEAPRQVRWAGWAITVVLIVGLSAALGYQWYFNAVNTLLLLSVFVLGSTAISAVISKLELSALGAISAIEQLGRYPANEKWIAVGEDTFVRPAEYATLRRQCRKNGLGLIVVTARGKMLRKVNPQPRHAFNNYLGSYTKKAAILKEIQQRPEYGPTPPERAKRFRQALNALVLLAIVGLLGLISYEEDHRPVVPDPFADEYAAQETTIFSPVRDTPGEAGADAGAGEIGGQATSPSDCSDFSVAKRSFIVVDALLSPANAAARLLDLTRSGISGFRTVPTECLNSWPAAGRYAVYKDTVFASRPAASRVAKAHKEAVLRAGLPFRYGRVVKVRPRR